LTTYNDLPNNSPNQNIGSPMSNIVDDLLQDVEELEVSTQVMDNDVQSLDQKKSTLHDSTQAAHKKILLKTAKTSQEAAKQSQSAATTAIKLSEQLKARSTELEELSNNWRQAVRNTLREQQTAQKYFAVMLSATLAISIISLSSIGYFFYLLNQQNAQHKGEVLDIIQTESTLLSNKITIKIDELAALTEGMSADIKYLNSQSNTSNIKQENVEPITTNAKETTKEKSTKPALNDSFSIEQLNAQHKELKTLIQELLSQASQKQTVKNISQTKQSVSDPAQIKKLNDLSWLIRKQDKALKTIQKTLSQKLASSSNDKPLQKTLTILKKELSTLNQQQTDIQQHSKHCKKAFQSTLKTPYKNHPTAINQPPITS